MEPEHHINSLWASKIAVPLSVEDALDFELKIEGLSSVGAATAELPPYTLSPPSLCLSTAELFVRPIFLRAGGDSDSNFENCDLFHAQSLDTGRGVHARSSWRVNRDVDVRR